MIHYDKAKLFIYHMSDYLKLTHKPRNKLFRSNHCLILCILSLLLCLLLTQRINRKDQNRNQLNEKKDIQVFITRIRDIAIFDQNFIFNITYYLISNDIPKWVHQYGVTHLFNLYWLQNGAYLWHLQRLVDFKQTSKPLIHQIFPENFNQTNVHDYLDHHPEYGIIIDTASDPIQPLFPPLPESSLSLDQVWERYQWLRNWYPCKTSSEITSSFTLKPLITYTLYDVTIDICDQCKHSSVVKIIHYDQAIYLFDSQEQITNEVFFVKQFLPRLIRLLALVPQSALILIPHLNTKVYINQYLDILIERKLINDRKRFIEYNSSEIYHVNVIYSTSSPRSDLILLNRILIGDKPPVRREFILVIRNNFDDQSYNEIIEIISQFELPEDFEYLHIEEYNEEAYDLKEISHLFRQARIVIGMPTNVLSHIVWCQERTHIIEIIQKTMTTEYYQISLQLRFNYWLAMTTKTNQIDVVDFRNLMMKVLTDIDA